MTHVSPLGAAASSSSPCLQSICPSVHHGTRVWAGTDHSCILYADSSARSRPRLNGPGSRQVGHTWPLVVHIVLSYTGRHMGDKLSPRYTHRTPRQTQCDSPACRHRPVREACPITGQAGCPAYLHIDGTLDAASLKNLPWSNLVARAAVTSTTSPIISTLFTSLHLLWIYPHTTAAEIKTNISRPCIFSVITCP